MNNIPNQKSILLVGWFFFPKLGGVESIILNQARCLIALGYNVSVLTSEVKGCPSDEIVGGIKVYRRKYINSEKSFSTEEIESDIEKMYKIKKFNLVHFHNGSYPAASNNMVAGGKNIITLFNFFKKNHVILIDHAHNAQLKNPEDTKQLRDLEWDCIIAVSDFVVSEWNSLGFCAKKMVRIYNGIDIDKFSNPKTQYNFKENEEIIILFPARVISMSLGRMSKQKNFQLLAKAASNLFTENISNFKIIAILNESLAKEHTKEGYSQLKVATKVLSDNNKIDFIEEVPNDEMPALYAASDVVCVPSIKETFGLVYLEAMACGKVVIASNTGGPREFIKNGKNGFLVDVDDCDELKERLKEIVESRDVREKISREAKKTAGEYSFSKLMDNLVDLYNQFDV